MKGRPVTVFLEKDVSILSCRYFSNVGVGHVLLSAAIAACVKLGCDELRLSTSIVVSSKWLLFCDQSILRCAPAVKDTKALLAG